MICFTPESLFLRDFFSGPFLDVEFTRFSDGELCVEIKTDVTKHDIWVIALTSAPADSFFNLFFLLDALQRGGSTIHLIITYCGYARQDRFHPGQPLSAAVIGNCFKQFNLQSFFIIHPHSELLHSFITFTAIYPFEIVQPLAYAYDCIVALDQGAYAFAQLVGKHSNRPAFFIPKVRSHEKIERGALGFSLHQKSVLLVDDIIGSGATLMTAVSMLEAEGVHNISAYMTHGIFSGNAYELIEQSSITTVYTTNTLEQKPSPKISIVNCVPLLKKIMASHP